jgi:hypothetical protein
MAVMSPEAMDRCKAATAMIANQGGSYAAFCIDKKGYYLTHGCGYSFSNNPRLILNAGEENQEILPFESVYSDNNIIILKVDRKVDCAVMEFGKSTSLVETADVTMFGFPDGKGLSANNNYPNVTVATGNVSSIRKDNRENIVIQFDSVSSRGNIGGPLCNDQGQVVGVVSDTTANTRLNFAVPINGILEQIKKRKFEISYNLYYEDILKDKQFDFKISTILPESENYDVEMMLWDTPDKRYAYKAEYLGKNNYSVKTTIPPVKVLPLYHVFAKIGERIYEFDTEQENIYCNGVAVPLRNGVAFNKGKLLLNNKINDGEVTGLDDMPLFFGKVKLSMNLSAADSVSIKANEQQQCILYCVNIKKGQNIVESFEGTMVFHSIRDVKNTTFVGNFNINETPLFTSTANVKVVAPISDVVTGYGGRYLFLYLKPIKKVAVFDVNSCSITNFVKVNTYNILMAAGNDKFLIYSPLNTQLIKYATMMNNPTFGVSSATINVDSLSMGAFSNGPVIVGTKTKTDTNSYSLYNSYSLEKIDKDMKPFTGTDLKVSGNGKVIYYQNEKSIASKAIIENKNITIQQGKFISVIPDIDGTLNYGVDNGIYDENLVQIKPDAFKGKYRPISEGNIFFSVEGGKISFYLKSSQKLFYTLNDKIIADIISDANFATKLPLEKSIFYVPQAKVLILIPATLDRVIAYHLDIETELKKSGIDYLYIASNPFATIGHNTEYQYKVDVKSSAGNVQYKIEKGPENMNISTQGILSWKAPFNDWGSTEVTIAVSDASGTIRRQSFIINKNNQY